MNIAQIAKDNNLSYNTVYMRLKRGVSKEEVIKPQRHNTRTSRIVVELDGVKISLNDAAKKYGLTYHTLYGRFQNLKPNQTIKDILFAPKKWDKVVVNYKGENLTLPEVAKKEGISYNTAYVRWKRGWDKWK